MKGTIKRIVGERGFGFITAEDSKEVFFHRSGLEDGVTFETLKEGSGVSFELGQGPKGPRAEHVKLG